MADKKTVVSVRDLHKSFRLPHEQHSGIKQKIINTLKGIKGYEEQHVLKGITFDIKKGDFFGIVGRNGSGKSTLLKLLAGIYTPDSGSVDVRGSLVPFIELGVGFNPELTGKENIFLNGALLGFSRKEMEAKYESIVEFSELEQFMDQKLKNYSSGMQVRLAFSIAIRAQGDIILLDEVLAVGDEAFQRKCFEYFARLKRDKKTVILVTHDMDAVRRFCNKALMIDKGEIVEKESVKAVSERYVEANADVFSQELREGGTKNKLASSNFADIEVFLKDGNDKPKEIFRNKPEDLILNVRAVISLKKDIDKESFCSILIKNANGEAIARFASEETKDASTILNKPRKGDKIVVTSKIQNIFGEGDYSIAVSFKSIDRAETYIESEDKATFSVVGLGKGKNGFALRPDNKTTFEMVRE